VVRRDIRVVEDVRRVDSQDSQRVIMEITLLFINAKQSVSTEVVQLAADILLHQELRLSVVL